MTTETLKTLGQAFPAANVLTALYTCGSPKGAATTSITVCNQTTQPAGTAFFSVSIAINGAADSPKQYIYYQLIIVPADTFIATIGITMAQGDVIRVSSTTGTVSFTLLGEELS